ncbi:hypothetical protein QQ045_006478 [Rhodiola kirilowii]
MFRFESMWMRDPHLKSIIGDNLSSAQGHVLEKLDDLKVKLTDWNRRHFGNVNRQLKNLKVELDRVRALPRTQDTLETETHIVQQIDEWLLREEQMWSQRSRVFWLRDGDNNTKYFHTKASSRRKANRIHQLYNSEGVICDDQAQIQSIACNYF